MEHIILSHIAKHVAANNFLIDQQHGFRQRFSCLLLKLDYYGICGKTAAWIKAFLGNRSQVVSVNGTHSALGLYLLVYPKAQYWDFFYSYYKLTILLITSSQQCVSLQMTALRIERLRILVIMHWSSKT